nr:hypothetical protein [Tanacetum cinerariifolium]
MVDVRRLNAHITKLRDMPEGVLVLPGLIIGIHDFLCLSEWTGAERKASTSSVASSHVAKRTRSSLAQSSGSTTQPSLFVGDDDESDDDACVEILLVTPLHSAAVIPSLGNHGGSSVAPTAEGSNTRDSRGKGIMVDDVVAPSGGEEWDAPYRPSFGVLTKEVFKDPAIYKTIVDQFPTPREMVRVEGLSDDQLTTQMSMLQCMMMPYGGELLARYHRLNQSHHEYVLLIDSRKKSYEEKVADLTGLELQVSTLKKQVSGLNDMLATFDASFSKSKAKGKERKKMIKSFSKSLDNLHTEVARLSATLNQATILDRGSECVSSSLTNVVVALSVGEKGDGSAPSSIIEELEPKKLVRPANVLIPRDTRVSLPIAKESTVTPVSKSLELSANIVPASSVVALEQNEEQMSVAVDGLGLEMTDGDAHSKSEECVSSSLTNVVVAFSAGEKGDGSAPSSIVEEVFVPPFGV